MKGINLRDSILQFISIFFVVVAIGQDTSDTLNHKSHLGLAADEFTYFLDNNGREYDTLIGNVKITQDSLFMFCNRAYVKDQVYVEAFGEVSIVQNDSIEIFSDSLIYDDKAQFANLFGEVIFRNGDKTLFTSEAKYDINTKRAFYNKGATLYNKSVELLSETGIYDIDQKKAFFGGKVVVRDSTFILNSDSLNYDLAREMIYLIAPTNIYTDSSTIYCEGGYFDYKKGEGQFYNNLQIITGERVILADRVHYYAKEGKYVLTGYPVVNDNDSKARADTIIYFDEEDKVQLIGQAFYQDQDRELTSYRIDYDLSNDEYKTVGSSEVVDAEGRIVTAGKFYREYNGNDIAESNVTLTDTEASTILFGDKLIIDNVKSEYKAFNYVGQPLLIKGFIDDSLFLKSDTLFYLNTDSTNVYRGLDNVIFLKGDISGKASDLWYSAEDSLYIFSGSPVIWSDSIQITGDTLKIKISQDKLDYLEVLGNAFMIMQSTDGSFNQVKGDKITNYFNDDALESSEVEGNVEMVYFMYEDGKLEGVNHSLCGALVFLFEAGNLENIVFLEKPNSKFRKGVLENTESYNLQGFDWNIKRKPYKEAFVK